MLQRMTRSLSIASFPIKFTSFYLAEDNAVHRA